MSKKCKYHAARYLRLSKDCNDKIESNSFSNQRSLIDEYVSVRDDIEIVDEMIDDGYSGSNFERPGFIKLIQAIKSKKINCIIVKDLSRFSRDYIGSGIYVMNLFPKWGVRLIAVNDNYDSLYCSSVKDELVFTFKSIVNDMYLSDISAKIKSNLETKRKNGEYTGAFVVYGYKKSPENKNKIIVDENVADNIKSIFLWVTDGISPYGIADKLNYLGILSPSDYKRSIGINHNSFNSKGNKAKWSAQTVMRIIKNEIYTGTLVQGKKTTDSYKVKTIVNKDKNQWVRVRNSHPPIVSNELFQIANEILSRDTRNANRQSESNVFSGMLFCEECKNTMIRRTSKYKDKKYIYYRCGTQKKYGTCSSHNIKESDLYEIILNAINTQIKLVTGPDNLSHRIINSSIKKDSDLKLNKIIFDKQEAIKNKKKDLLLTHQSYCNGIISRDDFVNFRAIYEEEIQKEQISVERMLEERESTSREVEECADWINTISVNRDLKELTHKLLVMLVDKIYISSNKKIKIVFRYQNVFERLKNIRC